MPSQFLQVQGEGSSRFRIPIEEQKNVVYQIPCAECNWNYVGETGRAFSTQIKEHIKNIKTFVQSSSIANHTWKLNHHIDMDNAGIIDRGNYRIRKTLESWHTASIKEADNNSKPLPGQYSILMKR